MLVVQCQDLLQCLPGALSSGSGCTAVLEIEQAAGNVTNVLKEVGIWDDTIFIFRFTMLSDIFTRPCCKIRPQAASHIVMAHIFMAYIFMAYIVMAYIVMALIDPRTAIDVTCGHND